MRHIIMLEDTATNDIFYKELLHSAGEYLACLFQLIEEVQSYPTVEILYFAPQPDIGKSKSKRFRHEEIVELAKSLPKSITLAEEV